MAQELPNIKAQNRVESEDLDDDLSIYTNNRDNDFKELSYYLEEHLANKNVSYSYLLFTSTNTLL